MLGESKHPQDPEDINEINQNTWKKIGGRGEFGDMNWGASPTGFPMDEVKPKAEELEEHIGETVLLAGGGGRSTRLGTLQDVKIKEYNKEGYKIRVYLENVRPKIGGDDVFNPILDSWQILVKTGDGE